MASPKWEPHQVEKGKVKGREECRKEGAATKMAVKASKMVDLQGGSNKPMNPVQG